MALLPKKIKRKLKQRRMDRYQAPLQTKASRVLAWLDMFFIDHGVFRCVYLNMHSVTEGVWRSAQPAPHHLKRYKAKNIRTIIYLRGGTEFGSWPLERDKAAQLGIELIPFVLRSRELPNAEEIKDFVALMESIEHPILFHCKSGADRAGFASALYLALIKKLPIEQAQKQLSLKYGHIQQSKTGVLDAFFDSYKESNAKSPLSLMQWIETQYDPKAIRDAFKPSLAGNALVDWGLRRE